MCTGAYLSHLHSRSSCGWIGYCWRDIRSFCVREIPAAKNQSILTVRSMLMQTTTLQQRSTYAGIGGATEAFAGLIAPMLGGVLVDSLTWKWCFYIQLPMTGIAFFVILLSFDGKRPQPAISEKFMDRIRSLDLLGTALFVPALSCLLLGLQWGGTRYGWSNWRILTAIGVFLVLIGTFSYWQYRQQDRATLPPRIILQRSVLSGFCFSCCNNASLAIVEYYVRHAQSDGSGAVSSLNSDTYILPGCQGYVCSKIWDNDVALCSRTDPVGVAFGGVDLALRLLQSVHDFNKSHHAGRNWPDICAHQTIPTSDGPILSGYAGTRDGHRVSRSSSCNPDHLLSK